MQKLSVSRFGLAMGGAFLILNIMCILSIVIFGSKLLANLITVMFHGINMSSFVSTHVKFLVAIESMAISFILGWILGTLTSFFYNLTNFKK